MENWLDACENRWLRRIMRIAYKDSITNETIRQRVPMSNRSRQMRLKWFGHVLRMKVNTLTKSVHLTGKRSTGRLNKRWMDCIEEDSIEVFLWRSGVTKCGKTAGRQRITLNGIAADRQHGGTQQRHQWLKSAGRWLPNLTVILQCPFQLYNKMNFFFRAL